MRKTYTYQLHPTPQHEQVMECVLRRCRALYTAGLQERSAAWERHGIGSTLARQNAHLPASKEVRPEYRDLHRQVLQEVLTRLDRAYHAFFRRVAAGEVSSRGIRGFKALTGLPVSPTSRLALVPVWTPACWSCPRWAGLPCAGPGRLWAGSRR